jgi:hypothetical protein
MRYTLVFGAPVVADGKTLGKVERIIVHNGIANQFTVDPGLFGTERLVPLSDIQTIGPNGIELRIPDDEWKAYPAFNIESLLPPEIDNPLGDPGLAQLTPQQAEAGGHRPDAGVLTTSVGVPAESITVPNEAHSAIVSAKTTVQYGGGAAALHGLVLDTGRPVQILVAPDQALDAGAVRSFTSEQISL